MRTGLFKGRLVRSGVLLAFAGVALTAQLLNAQTSASYPTGADPIGVVFDGVNIWVTNSGSGNVTKLLASTGATVGTYPAGTGPYGIAFDGANIWVANSGSNTVTKLLASTGAIVGTYPVGSLPESGVVFDGANIWVTNAGSNTVTKLLASTGAALGTYSVGAYPEGAAFDGTNIWVADGNNASVTKLLASTGTIVGTYPAGPTPGAMAYDGANVWVANAAGNSVTKLLASTGAMLGTYPAGSNPQGIAFDGAHIWVTNDGNSTATGNTVTELLASTGALVGTYATGASPSGIAFDGANIWVANANSGNVTKISGSSGPVIFSGGVVPIFSAATTIEPGSWVSIYGSNLASAIANWNGDYPTTLGGVTVTIDGKNAYLCYVSPTLINLQAPDDTKTGLVSVTVTNANGSSTSTVTLGQVGPSFLLIDGKHVAGIIPRTDGSGAFGGGSYDKLGPTGSSLGYPTVAAKPGDVVELYAVGFGPTTTVVPAGQGFAGATPISSTFSLLVNNIGVTPFFVGLSGAGLDQINLTVPASLGTGDVPLEAIVGGVQTPSGVVISLQNTPAANPTLTITTSGTGSGTVGASPSGTSCGAGCLSFAPGTVVALTAVPSAGATFAGWSGACSGTGSYTLTMSANQAVAAEFNLTTSPQTLSITSLSNSTLAPLNLLVITGSGFDPTAQLQVTFSDSNTYSIAVPVLSATSTSLMTSVPEYFNQSGNLTGGTVNIMVSQTSLSGFSSASNTYSGFQIQALPAASPLSAGTLTLALLQAEVQDAIGLQSTVGGSSIGTASMQAALSSQVALLQTLVAQVQSVTAGASGTFTIGQLNGADINVGSQALAQDDQLLLGLLTTFAGQAPDLSAFGTSVRPLGFASAASSAPNPVQAAAQAALAAAMAPLTPTGLNQLNTALANFVASFAICDPKLALAYTATMSGVFAGAFAVNIVGAPALLLSAQLAFEPGIEELNAAIEIKERATLVNAVNAVGVALVADCAEGLSIFNSVKTLAVGVLTKAVPGGTWAELLETIVNIHTIIEQGGCSSGSEPIPSLAVTPTSLTFNATSGSSSPASQALTISSSGVSFCWQATATSTPAWLSVAPTSGNTTPAPVGVSVAATGLEPGIYAGTVTVASTGEATVSQSPQSIPVTLTVNPALTTGTSGTGTGTVSVSPPGTSCGSGCLSFTLGAIVTLTATPATGSTFNGWSGACSGQGTCTVTMSANETVTSEFNTVNPSEKFTLSVIIAGDGSGVVTANPTGLLYADGISVTLTATPNSQSLFAGWGSASGHCTGNTSNTCTFTVTEDDIITATFNLPVLTMTTAGSGAGTITVLSADEPIHTQSKTAPRTTNSSSQSNSYPVGTMVTLRATANSFSTFTGWSGACSGLGNCNVTMTANLTVTANFSLNPTLSISMAGTATGGVSASPTGASCGTGCLSFAPGTVIALTAVPSAGATFAGWSGACSGTGSCTVTMNSNQAVTATFNMTSGGSGGGTGGTGGGTGSGGLSGTWTGNTTEDGGGCIFIGTSTWNLVQSGSTVTGTISYNLPLTSGPADPCGTTATLTDTLKGSYNGTALILTGTEGETFSASVSGSTITGSGQATNVIWGYTLTQH